MIHRIERIVACRIAVLVLVVCSPFIAFTQNLSQHNWYFGNSNKGIRFNRANNAATLVTNKANPFGTGGSAVATDPATANLFFYTDGNNVFDATHTLMPNGSGLSANAAANQPVAVCAVPGQPNRYYIFTNSANFTAGGTISVSVVDMTAFGNSSFPSPPLGVVTTKNVPVPGLPNRSEGMAVVPHSNGVDFWLISQQVNSQTYSATLINAATFTGTYTTQNITIGNSISVANFAYNRSFKKFAVSAQNSNTDALILTFNNDGTAPVLALDKTIANSGTSTVGNQSIYDIEWDRAGQYLYLSRTGDASIPADLLQYDYLNPLVSLSTVLKTPVFRSYGLQVAPDSAIYFLYQNTSGGPFLVDKFTKTDTIATSVIRTPTPFGAANNFNGTQFPSFLPQAKVDLKVDFTFNNKPNCQNNPTTFYPSVIPNADSLQWNFGDGSDTTQWSPVHIYLNAGTFNVQLRAFYQGQVKDTIKKVTIVPFALKLTLVADTTACQCQLPARKKLGGACSLPDFSVTVKVKGGTGNETYLWSNGNTTATLRPDSAGYYYVVVTDPSTQCATYAGVNVKEFKLQDQRQNIWFFGNNAGIDFNVMTPKALSGSNMNAPEGCAIVCDRNGQTIFYTDGSNVYNKNNVLIDTGIGGDPQSSQSSLIIPVTGDETLYYIFTTQSIDGLSQNALKYSLYDLKKDSVVKKDVLLFTKSTERITGNDRWLIAHEYGNNTFRAYPISNKGIGDPVYSAIGSDHSFGAKENGQGYMKLGGTNLLAVALSTPGTTNLVEVFDFIDSTGLITNYRKIDLKTTAGQVYGVEFSSGGNKLFATVDGLPKPSFIYEYAFDSLGMPHLKNKSAPINEELGAIQIGPDGQVYVAVNGATSLGLIAAVEDTTQVSPFVLNGFALAPGTNSNLGLPNFKQQISNAFGGPGFTFNNSCIGDTTKFAGTSRDPIDLFDWSFGDGGSSTQSNPTHLYQAPGTYTVVMKLHNRCPNSLDSSVQKVNIYPKPPKPTLPPSSILCNGPVVLDANTVGLPGTSYSWSTGDTTKTITVKKAAFLSVTNTDINGCQSTAQGTVGDVRPKVNFGPDQTLCQASASPVLKAGFGTTYTWTVPAGVTPTTTSTQQVDVSSPFTVLTPQTYSVVVSIVIDPVTTCTNADTITYTVKPMPTFTFTGINPAGACGTPTGSTILTLTGPESVLYSYDILGPGAPVPSGIDQPVNGVPITNPAQAGVYTAIVTNQVSLCQAQNQVNLSDQTVNVTAASPLTTCTTVAITASTNVATPFQYQVTDAAGTVVDSNPSVATGAFSTKPLLAGDYILQVTGGTCVATANVQIAPASPSIPFTLVADVCGSPNQTITASPAVGPTYVWDPGTGIVSGTNSNVLVINPGAGGPFTYTVTASQSPAFCPTTQSIIVNIPPQFTAAFTQGDPCADQVMLTATPSGNYSYRWYLDTGGTFNFVAAGQVILVNAGGTYRLEVADLTNGCIQTTASKLVTVNGVLTAGITVTQACADGKPFTLTATSNQASVTYKWYLNNVLISGAASATLDQTSEGTYKVEVSNGPCTTPAEITVKRQPIPSGQLPDNAIICDDPDNNDPNTAKVNLDPGNFVTYNWFKDNLTLGYTDEIYTAESAGVYSVALKNIYNCIASDQTVVVNNCEPVVTAPNAFRPSSSITSNEQFKVFSFFVTDNFQIFIFNRWGEMVYQSNDRYFQWNGTSLSSGQPMPGGTYAYVIKYVSAYRPENGIQEKHGGVVLLR